MNWEAQHDALRLRFATQWGTTTVVHWPNTEFTPPDNTEWVRLHIEDSPGRPASFGDPGNNVYRHNGVVTVMIFCPVNLGDERALQLADQASAIFRGWQDLATGLRFWMPPFLRQIGVERKWYHLNVLCPFERDTHF